MNELTTLVGRHDVSAALRGALDQLTSTGSGSGWLFTGESGIGKSTMCRSLLGQATSRNLVTALGRATRGADEPLRPLRELLAPLLRTTPALVGPSLGGHRAALDGLLPHLDAPETAASPLSIAESLLRLFDRIGRSVPLVVVLEDLHQADATTTAVVTYLLDHAAEIPAVVLATAEPHAKVFVQAVDAGLASRHHRLKRLPPREAAELVRARAPSLEAAEVAEIVARADGLPLALVQFAVHGDVETLPPGLLEHVSDRLESLSAGARAVVRCVSLANEISGELLSRALGCSERELVAAVQQGRDGELLAPGWPARPASELFGELVLAQLPPAVGAELGARLLPHLDADREATATARLAGLLGDHYLERSARRALAARRRAEGEHSAAIPYLRRCLVLTENEQERPELERELVEALSDCAQFDEATTIAARLSSVLDRGEARRMHCEVGRAAFFALRGDVLHAQVRAVLDVPAAVAADPIGQSSVELLRAWLAVLGDEPELALERAAGARRVADGDRRIEALAWLAESRAFAYLDVERCDHAERQAEQLARAAGLPEVELAVAEARALRELWATGATAAVDTLVERATRQGHHGIGLRLELARLVAARIRLEVATARSHRAVATDLLDSVADRPPPVAAHRDLSPVRREDGRLPGARVDELVGSRAEVHAAVRTAAYLELATLPPGQIVAGPNGTRAVLERVAHLLRGRQPTPGPWRGTLALLRAIDGEQDLDGDLIVAQWETLDRAMIELAHAVRAGRAGDAEAAASLHAAAESRVRAWSGGELLWQQAMRHVAEVAAEDGWGHPVEWLQEVIAWLDQPPSQEVAEQARALLRDLGAPVPRRATGVDPALREHGITRREAEILALVVSGLSSRQIGEQLHISVRTVDKHVQNATGKLGVSSRGQVRDLGRR